MGVRRRRLKDRYDGRLIRSLDPFYKIIPYIMPTRLSAQVFFEEALDADVIERYIREKRAAGYKNFGFLHVLITAMVRVLSQHPKLNRFIAGQKIYARNEVLISFVIKKKVNEHSSETTVKLSFNPEDTVFDVFEKVSYEIQNNKDEKVKNSVDHLTRLFMLCPGFIVKLAISLLQSLDNRGLMPKALNRISPLHTSVFVTNVASLGIQPIYHHLYEVGTASIFIAFGTKQKHGDSEGKFIPLKIVADERIADGYAFASAFKLFKSIFKHPERLDNKPEHIVLDIE